MKVKYSEGLAEVSVEGIEEPVKRNHQVEVPDELGKQLLKQGWEKVSPASKTAEGKSPATPNSVEKEKK